jgi:PD-(D/E)XK endonuclease
VLAAMKAGVRVLLPAGEHAREDLVLDIAGRLWRVQVKWGRLSLGRDVVIVALHPVGSRPMVTCSEPTALTRST